LFAVVVAGMRLKDFVVGLTNNDPAVTVPVYKQYDVVVQYNGIVEPLATASVSFESSENTFRYVIIQQDFAHPQAICIMEVKVFLRGIYQLLRHVRL